MDAARSHASKRCTRARYSGMFAMEPAAGAAETTERRALSAAGGWTCIGKVAAYGAATASMTGHAIASNIATFLLETSTSEGSTDAALLGTPGDWIADTVVEMGSITYAVLKNTGFEQVPNDVIFPGAID